MTRTALASGDTGHSEHADRDTSMRAMSQIRRTMIVACTAVTVGVATPAWGDPANPDFSRYMEDDLGDYSRCSQKLGAGPHCLYQFKSSDDGGNFVCGVIPTTSSAYCADVVDPGVTAREISIRSSGGANSRSQTGEDGDYSGAFEASQTLPPLHKIVYGGGITCGTGEDGSVACANAAGHGFVLSHDGSKTW